MRLIFFSLIVLILALSQLGCGGEGGQVDEHSHAEGETHHHEPHYHEPPHGGAGVTLGNEDAHIEFLADAEEGTVTAWFFKPHMEQYLRMELESFEVLVKRSEGETKLVFEALANPGTGETVGNTSQFVANAEWLGKAETFDAVIPEITVLGKTYNNLEFNYPKGN